MERYLLSAMLYWYLPDGSGRVSVYKMRFPLSVTWMKEMQKGTNKSFNRGERQFRQVSVLYVSLYVNFSISKQTILGIKWCR